MIDDFAEIADDRGRWFGKKYRLLGIFDFQLPRSRAFVDMFAVIDAEHDDSFFSALGIGANDFRLVGFYQRATAD